jgi:DNA adenine methylase
VFFDLHDRGLLDAHRATLSDGNADLVACYRTVRECTAQVIAELSKLARDHQLGGAAHYYDVRDNRFNPQRAAMAAASNGEIRYTASLAAMFVYLNRTGYNGLFRLNASGEFNVPAGRYIHPRICDEENIQRVAGVFGRPGTTLAHGRFDRVLDEAAAGDFLYFDPPYAPLSRTARFTSYTAGGFTLDDQTRLRAVLVELAVRGCHVVMSNSTAPEIADLYERNGAVKASGLRCYRVPARRAINSNATRRGVVEEYVITNVSPSGR